MPYVTLECRKYINDEKIIKTGGDLNYALFKYYKSVLIPEQRYRIWHELTEIILDEMYYWQSGKYSEARFDVAHPFIKEICKLAWRQGLKELSIAAALDNSKSEFYWRYVRPMEDRVITKNGDVE